MYSTEYRLVKDGDKWVNKNNNKMSMSQNLADTIIKTVFSTE